jgi:hypothetical protein
MKRRLPALVTGPAERAGKAVRDAAGKAAQEAATRARSVAQSVGGLASRSAGALPDASTVRRRMGDALVMGGKLLYDPRATVGEIAIALGQGLRPDPAAETWLVLRATETGFEVLAHGAEAEMRIAWERARDSGSVLLCRAVAASAAAGAPPERR